jgi:hypothetical protein
VWVSNMCDQSKLLDAALSFVALIEITLKKEGRERERERERKKNRKKKCRACLYVCDCHIGSSRAHIERMKVVIKKA